MQYKIENSSYLVQTKTVELDIGLREENLPVACLKVKLPDVVQDGVGPVQPAKQ